MRIGANPALAKMIQDFAVATGKDSDGGRQVTQGELAPIIDLYKGLSAEEKAEVAPALKKLALDAAQSRFTSFDDGAKDLLHSVLGLDKAKLVGSDLSQMDKAAVAGLRQTKSVLEATMASVRKIPQIKAATIKNISKGFEEFGIPKEHQKVFAGILQNMFNRREATLDTNAKPVWKKMVAELNQDGGVTETQQAFNAKRSDTGTTAFQRALASGGFFEDIIAAFMFDMIQEIQSEVLAKTGEMDRKRDLEAQDQAGNVKKAGDDMIDAARASGTGESTGPKYTEGDIAEVRKQLEALVQKTDFHKKNDGVIDRGEAEKIAERLGKLKEPIDRLLADSTLKALVSTDLDLNGTIAPIVEWACGVLGKNGIEPDLSRPDHTMKTDGAKSDDAVVQALANSDRLEDKIASFVIQAFVITDDKKSTGEKVKALNEAKEQWGEAAQRAGTLLDGQTPQVDKPATEGAQTPAAEASTSTGAADGAGKADAAAPGRTTDAELRSMSRQELQEELKKLMQEMQQALQSLSNILNMMKENAMNSIRSIR